jgi:hypothetical protein
MTDPNSEQPQWSNFVYENQSGTAASASAHDFAKATGVTLTLSGGNTLTVDNVNFQLMQSMFRQHLVFVDENGDAISPAPVISSLKIESKNSALVKFIKPSDNVIGHDPIKINDFSGSDLYLALTFAYDVDHPAEGDKLSVIVTDEDGKKYYCSKNAPQNGFANGKYYHGTMTLKYAPVVRTDNGYEPVVKNAQGKYILEDGGEYTVQGTVNGSIEGSGSISLNIEEESVINGCVNLRSIYDKTWKDVNINTSYYGTVTINNPGQVALQAASDLPTNISIGTTLIVNGSVSGNCNLDGYGCIMQVEENLVDGSYYLADGCFLNVKGDLGNVTITASFNSSGTQNAEITNEYYPYSGYKVFYGGESSFIPEPEPEPEPETEP